MVFSAFQNQDCYVGSEFLCNNHKCIPATLECDGFDHCGDNSDEAESCKDGKFYVFRLHFANTHLLSFIK